jgi:xylulokinase
MEGVVFSLHDSLEIMRHLGVPIRQIRVTGGGARSSLWRQLQADIYNVPVRRTIADEGPAYGAALLGGVAAGVFKDVQEASSRVELREEITRPDPERVKLYDEYYEVYRSLYPLQKETMLRLTGLARRAEA